MKVWREITDLGPIPKKNLLFDRLPKMIFVYHHHLLGDPPSHHHHPPLHHHHILGKGGQVGAETKVKGKAGAVNPQIWRKEKNMLFSSHFHF